MELLNAYPSVYKSDVIEPGLCSYEDSQDGVWKVTKPTLDKMRASAIGIPVVIGHQKVTPENYEELRKNGIIVGNVINARVGENGWDSWDILIDRKNGRDKVDIEKYSVSCAYRVNQKGEGGLWHDIKYDGEILDASYTHLALVDSPRYEDATIKKQSSNLVLMNGKTAHITPTTEDKEMNFDALLKVFNLANEKKVAIDPPVTVGDKTYKLSEVMVGMVALNEKIEKGQLIESPEGMKGVHAKPGTFVDINGHSYKVNEKGELINVKDMKNCNCGAKGEEGHKEGCEMYQKKNEKEEEEKKKKEEEEKKNAKIAADKAVKDAEELLNAKKKEGVDFFNALNTLSNFSQESSAPAPTSKFMTREERANKKKLEVAERFKK